MSRQLSKKTLDKSFWNWFFWNGCSQQAESMLGMAFGQAMAPVVDELYDSKEEKAEALKRHVTLFNTEAQVGSICNGIVCGMEEANANGQCTPDVINTVKVALIGPTSAIGDSLWVATIIPILLTICMSISQGLDSSMAWVGAAIYLLAYPVLTCILSRKLFYFGYKSGLEGMSGFMATRKMDILTNSMNFMGLLVVGALTASFVSCSIPFQIVKDVFDAATGEVLAGQVIFNADATINNIFPRLVPLGLTLGVYWLYAKKKWSPLKLMGLILVLAAILTGIGYMSGFYA
ncbi:PTS system mannose/fructose/sorbose family transporter subunit IID [Lachnoclostridium pacaense]|uniref:PTS system mannose/fructose/sorbose family transporter subunit IID n=1 Tax=Enterocloster hominis (ex Hitch et al. 2024) TaxID=1917870 RepID=UPI001D12D0F9|nr:PTS system mannose/fructose/sorbose family transporter subunit IID [Lachnoclostridium pacaense]MCC2878815.1 PTS system mannose/fructose/sorbose family transporter subunit IID [Lachnoclostridium pacaense]